MEAVRYDGETLPCEELPSSGSKGLSQTTDALSQTVDTPSETTRTVRVAARIMAQRANENGPREAGRSSMLEDERSIESQSKTGVSTPSTLCSFGLVVVYCRWMRFSGKM